MFSSLARLNTTDRQCKYEISPEELLALRGSPIILVFQPLAERSII
jgi:hypothetical protein